MEQSKGKNPGHSSDNDPHAGLGFWGRSPDHRSQSGRVRSPGRGQDFSLPTKTDPPPLVWLLGEKSRLAGSVKVGGVWGLGRGRPRSHTSMTTWPTPSRLTGVNTTSGGGAGTGMVGPHTRTWPSPRWSGLLGGGLGMGRPRYIHPGIRSKCSENGSNKPYQESQFPSQSINWYFRQIVQNNLT